MPDQTADLQHRLRLAHQARRAKEHQLDDIRRALCDAGFMHDDDPYGHADLAGVIRQAGEAERAASAQPEAPCRCGHRKDQHGDERDGSWAPQSCSACPGDEERSWRHPYTPEWPIPRVRDMADVPDAELTPQWREHLNRVPPTPAPCSINHDCPGQPRPEPLTARGEARCQSQHRAEGEPLVQCALAVHTGGLAHTDYDALCMTITPPYGRPADLPWIVWRDKAEEADRG